MRALEEALPEKGATSKPRSGYVEPSTRIAKRPPQRIKKPSLKLREHNSVITKSHSRRTARARSPRRSRRQIAEQSNASPVAKDEPYLTFGVEMEIVVHTDVEQYRSQLPSELRKTSPK